MSSTGQRPAPVRGSSNQLQPQMPKITQDPQGRIQASSPDLTGFLSELTRMANTIQAGGLGMIQHQIDSSTAAIHDTTRPVALFALTPWQQQANDIIDYGTATGTKLYEKATAALKHAFDHQEGCILPSHLKSRRELRK